MTHVDDDVALATYERRVDQLFRARRWAGAWKYAAHCARMDTQERDEWLDKANAKIAKLENTLRPFTAETDHHKRECECRYCHARKVLGDSK